VVNMCQFLVRGFYTFLNRHRICPPVSSGERGGFGSLIYLAMSSFTTEGRVADHPSVRVWHECSPRAMVVR
jgi:hypothetical protein